MYIGLIPIIGIATAIINFLSACLNYLAKKTPKGEASQ